MKPHQERTGNIMVVSALFIGVLVSITALVVDIGYLGNARAELQRCADAAALAACWEMGQQFAVGANEDSMVAETRDVAKTVAGLNEICNSYPALETSDVTLGYVQDLTDRSSPPDTSSWAKFNSVTVRVRRDNSINGQVQTFFARALGVFGLDAEAKSTAMMLREIKGFKTPVDGSNLDILPFSLDLQTWNDLIAGVGQDDWKWDAETREVVYGADGTLEVNLYPQDTGAPGNRGTVDIGGSNNSTADIARQILYGISPNDMAAMGGTLEFGVNGQLILNGDTGISAGVKDELSAIIGQTRIIPIFSAVHGPGNNADYTIVKWAGVRILDVRLTGPRKQKRLMIQPAPISTSGIIIDVPDSESSSFVYSRAFLIR